MWQALFCSELVAALYIDAGWLNDSLEASRYLPKDFGVKHTPVPYWCTAALALQNLFSHSLKHLLAHSSCRILGWFVEAYQVFDDVAIQIGGNELVTERLTNGATLGPLQKVRLVVCECVPQSCLLPFRPSIRYP